MKTRRFLFFSFTISATTQEYLTCPGWDEGLGRQMHMVVNGYILDNPQEKR